MLITKLGRSIDLNYSCSTYASLNLHGIDNRYKDIMIIIQY